DDRSNYHRAYTDGQRETMGDRSLARWLLRKGVFLDERYGAMFNGESPIETKIYPGMGCVPLMGFHGLSTTENIESAKPVFEFTKGNPEEPVRYIDLFTT